jgi:hypothetical protein
VVRAVDISTEITLIEPGDIFACFGSDPMSRFISLETSLLTWPIAPAGLRLSPSHVAIACPRFAPDHSSCWWFESTTMSRRPCLESKTPVQGVQVHAVADRLRDYCQTGHVDLYRLTPINRLAADEIRNMRSDLIQWFIEERIGYDAAGAVFSGTRLIRSLDKLTGILVPRMESVFCSQLIAAELMSLGRMNRDNPQRYNPGRLLRVLVQQGTYTRIRSFGPQDLQELSR